MSNENRYIYVNDLRVETGHTSVSHEKILKLVGRFRARITYRRGGYDVVLSPGESMPIHNGQRFKLEEPQ